MKQKSLTLYLLYVLLSQMNILALAPIVAKPDEESMQRFEHLYNKNCQNQQTGITNYTANYGKSIEVKKYSSGTVVEQEGLVSNSTAATNESASLPLTDVDIAITATNFPDTLYTLTSMLGSWTISNVGNMASPLTTGSLITGLYPLNSTTVYAPVFTNLTIDIIPAFEASGSMEYVTNLYLPDVVYPPTSGVSPIQTGDYLLCIEWFGNDVTDTNPANNRVCEPVHVSYGDVYAVSNATATVNNTNSINYHANITMTSQQYYIPYSFQLSVDNVPSPDDIVLSVGTYYTYDNPYDNNVDVSIVIPNNIASGTYYLIAQYGAMAVENTGTVIESNYNNNITISSITISSTFVSDVAVLNTNLQTDNEQLMGWFIVQNNTNTINNIGLYLSTDNIFSPDDVILKNYSNDAFYSQQIYIDAVVPYGTPSGDYYLIIVADDNNIITETNEANNIVSLPFSYGGAVVGADVAITNVSTINPVPDNTDILNIDYSLQNVGTLNSILSSLYVSVYDSNGEIVLDKSGSYTGITLSPNSTVSYSYSLTGIDVLPAGTYTALIALDNTGDTNMSNNIATLPFTITNSTTDLVAELYYLPNYAATGSNLNIPYRIKNALGTAVSSSQARMYISTDNTLSADDLLVADIVINNLEIYQTYDNTQVIQIPANFSGSVLYVILVADANNDITENNENNNIYVAYTNIIGQGSSSVVDLMLDNIQSPNTLSALQQFTIGVRVWNLGNGDAPISTVKYYLSTDYYIQEDEDLYLGEKIIPVTLANTKATHLHTLTLPSGISLGAYYLLAKTDAENEVIETNEYNNTNFKAVNIVGDDIPTNYTDIALQLSCDKNGTVYIYEFVTYTLTVTNTGNIPATGVQVMFKKPDNLAYSSDNTIVSSATTIANYDYWFGTLDITQLLPNETVTVVLNLYHATAPNPIVCFAQVLDANEADIDSQPNNNSTTTPTEDDEALIVLNDGSGNQANKEHTISGITSLHLNHVYPSPTTTNLHLNLYNTTERNLRFNIYDIQGRLVRVVEQTLHEGINDVLFDVSDLSEGMYWIQSNLGERAAVFIKQ